MTQSEWLDILWREWRNTDDLEYADWLYGVLEDDPRKPRRRALLLGLGFTLASAAMGLPLGLQGLGLATGSWLWGCLQGASVLAACGAFVTLWRRVARLDTWDLLLRWLLPGRTHAGSGLVAAAHRLLCSPTLWATLGRWHSRLGGVPRGRASASAYALVALLLAPIPLLVLVLYVLAVLLEAPRWAAGRVLGGRGGPLVGELAGPLAGAAAVLIALVAARQAPPGLALAGVDLAARLLAAVGLPTVAVYTVAEAGGGHRSDDPTHFRRLVPWWRRKPSPVEVVEALAAARAWRPDFEAALPECLVRVDEFLSSGRDPREVVRMLTARDPRDRFVASLVLANSGGEAAEALIRPIWAGDRGHAAFAYPLLRHICDQSVDEVHGRERDLLCPDCLVRPAKMRLRIPKAPDLYLYGCRRCRRSRGLLEWPGRIAAVLGRPDEPERADDGATMRVNWAARSEAGLFDFTEVEVGAASDEDIRRFVVQVANDTDEKRHKGYTTMACTIRPDARLEPTTLRQLEETFGEVRTVP